MPKSWQLAADGIYAKGLAGELLSPISVDYDKPKAIAATTDEAKSCPKEDKADVVHGHNCTCHHSLDELPKMNKQERQAYDLLVKLADDIKDKKKYDVDAVIEEMTNILREDAKTGAIDGATALKLLAKKEIAGEISKVIKAGDVYISESLNKRLSTRTAQLVKGYADYTQKVIDEVLNSSGDLSANEITARLAEVMPRSRAELIARNETTYAIRSGRLEQDEALAEKYGLNVKLVWRTSGDSDVCDVCAAMEGETVELGKAFADSVETNDGETVSWEHSSWNDNGRIPDAHPNCRCYFDEVIE